MYGSVLELNMTFLVHVNRTFSALLNFSSKPAYNSAEHREYGFKFSFRFNMAATYCVTAPCVLLFYCRQMTIGSWFRLLKRLKGNLNHAKAFPVLATTISP